VIPTSHHVPLANIQEALSLPDKEFEDRFGEFFILLFGHGKEQPKSFKEECQLQDILHKEDSGTSRRYMHSGRT
jgi:hypothetical protein